MTGKEIRAFRKRWKYRQQDLAAALKVRQATVSGWESGKTKPHPIFLRAIEELDNSLRGGERRWEKRIVTPKENKRFLNDLERAITRPRRVKKSTEAAT